MDSRIVNKSQKQADVFRDVHVSLYAYKPNFRTLGNKYKYNKSDRYLSPRIDRHGMNWEKFSYGMNVFTSRHNSQARVSKLRKNLTDRLKSNESKHNYDKVL